VTITGYLGHSGAAVCSVSLGLQLKSCQFILTGMNIEQLSVNLSSDDPAIGLRASLALHRLAERVEAHNVASAREKGWSWQQIGDALGVTANPCTPNTTRSHHDHRIRCAKGASRLAIYLRASEEARRRGDRRTGTDHILLALFEDPSIEVALGVSLQQARQALESLDHEAWAPWAWVWRRRAPTADARRAEEAEA